WDGTLWLPEALPLLGQPAAPLVARVIKQPLGVPEPTHPIRHSPLLPPLLACGVYAHALVHHHLSQRLTQSSRDARQRHRAPALAKAIPLHPHRPPALFATLPPHWHPHE